MEKISHTTLVPVEKYLGYSDKPNCEYREGVLYPKPMPTTFHGLLEFMLVVMLRKLGLQAVAEVTVRLSPTRYLVPDVIAAPVLTSPYPAEPVLLCCEILSLEDRLGTMLAKCEEYHAWGVPFCWVVDPVKRTAWEYHSASEPVRVTLTLRAGALSVSLDELFSALDTTH
jgi:Uma2 family endonuclease